MERLLELMQHDLEVLDIFHVELGDVLLELNLFIINLVLQLNNSLCKSQLRSNGSMEGDTEANWELKIIKTEVWATEPLINELVQDLHIKEGKIIEDTASCLLFIGSSRASSPRSSSLDRSMA